MCNGGVAYPHYAYMHMLTSHRALSIDRCASTDAVRHARDGETSGCPRPSRPRRRAGPTVPASICVVAVVAIVVGLLGTSPRAGSQSADGLDGDTYASERYAWSVTFDDGFWEAEELDEPAFQGVRLTGADAVANLRVYDDGIIDTGPCLDELVRRSTTDSDAFADLAPADELDPPATATDAESTLYAGTLTDEDEALASALYLECREVEDATLAVDITILRERYDTVKPEIEGLLDGIDYGDAGDSTILEETTTPDDSASDPVDDEDATPASDDTAEPAAEVHADGDRLGDDRAAAFDDDSYASRLGYTLTYDPEVFETTGDDGSRGVDLAALEEELTVSVLAFEDPSIVGCVDREVAAVLANPDNASASRSSGTRLPATADDASGALVRVVEDTARRARLIVYVECRPLADEGPSGDPTFVVVRAISGEASFRRTRALVEDLLAGLSVDGESADTEETPSTSESSSADAGDAPADAAVSGETDFAAGVFVGVVIPSRIEWDPAYWVGAETEIGVTLTAVDGASILSIEQYSVGPGSGFTEAGCVLGPLDGFAADLPDLAEAAPAAGQEIAWPDRVGNTQSAGTLALGDGATVTQIVAVGCLELAPAERYLRFVFTTVDVVYPVSVAELNLILASLVVEESASGGATQRAASLGTVIRFPI